MVTHLPFSPLVGILRRSLGVFLFIPDRNGFAHWVVVIHNISILGVFLFIGRSHFFFRCPRMTVMICRALYAVWSMKFCYLFISLFRWILAFQINELIIRISMSPCLNCLRLRTSFYWHFAFFWLISIVTKSLGINSWISRPAIVAAAAKAPTWSSGSATARRILQTKC